MHMYRALERIYGLCRFVQFQEGGAPDSKNCQKLRLYHCRRSPRRLEFHYIQGLCRGLNRLCLYILAEARYEKLIEVNLDLKAVVSNRARNASSTQLQILGALN